MVPVSTVVCSYSEPWVLSDSSDIPMAFLWGSYGVPLYICNEGHSSTYGQTPMVFSLASV